MDYKAEQEMELEALQAILMDDIEGKVEDLKILSRLYQRVILWGTQISSCFMIADNSRELHVNAVDVVTKTLLTFIDGGVQN